MKIKEVDLWAELFKMCCKECEIVKVCGNFIQLKETNLPVKRYLDSLILQSRSQISCEMNVCVE
jgi:hypothetical protein